jgi:hypothetical protein
MVDQPESTDYNEKSQRRFEAIVRGAGKTPPQP